jgi:hypothetical protein
MWYVERIVNWQTQEKEMWVGLTQDQSRSLHSELSQEHFSGNSTAMIRSGKMDTG